MFIVKQHKIEKVSKQPTVYYPDYEEIYYDCYCSQYFDGDKLFLGVNNGEDAKQAYLTHYVNHRFLGPISRMTIDDLKFILVGTEK